MPNPIAVLISDVHYNLNTLELADASMRQAIAKANSLKVLLIVAGDLHDTKANMRAECINAMINTFKQANTRVVVLRGNHDSVHEKSTAHSLEFLRPYVQLIVDHHSLRTMIINEYSIILVPYFKDRETFLKDFSTWIPEFKGSIVIMHQGIQGSNSGEYIQDKSAITKEDVAGFRVISGHYHARQTIDLPDGGKWDYIGNPYTLNFGEANDPEKGYQILMDDGSLEFVPTNLRKHLVYETTVKELKYGALSMTHVNLNDLVKVKVTGTKEELGTITKKSLSGLMGIEKFQLELITEASNFVPEFKKLSKVELLDSLIDQSNASDECKNRLKNKWKGIA